MGVALTSCTVPAAGRPTFDIGDTEIGMGVGIHGEPGRRREAMRDAKALVTDMVNAILEDFSQKNMPLNANSDVLLLVNGFAATPLMELYLIYNEAAQAAIAKGGKTESRTA